MSIATQSTETLFQNWRRGDASAGQAMAQRFTDWFFAISACRLGEGDGEPAFREACSAFSRGVGRVADARRLLGWAHGIVREQVYPVDGGRRAAGDPPNAWTRKQPPRQLLLHARQAIPDVMALVEPGYRDGRTADPAALLHARYALKAWLKQRFEIPFRVLPERADADRAPLPFYESGHMADENEETHFELYMLTDMEVCQDVAEFAHYAIALRGGLPGEMPVATSSAATVPSIPSVADTQPQDGGPTAPRYNPVVKAVAKPDANGLPPIVWAAGAAAAVLAAVAAILYILLG